MKSGKKKYDYKNFNDLTDDKIFNINLSWMYNPQLYDEISQDVFAKHNKDKHSNELLSIQTFLDNINNKYIKNKKYALEEFKTVKNNVKSENLKDIVKELDRAIFGYDDDDDDDNKKPKFEESIAQRTKMRRQNKEYEEGYDSAGYDSAGYDGAGYDEWGFNKDEFNKDEYNNLGFNKDEFNKDRYNRWGFNEDGFNKDGIKDKKFNKFGYNTNGIDRKGFNENGYNINGYSNSGYDRDYYNINGYNSSGYDRNQDHYNING